MKKIFLFLVSVYCLCGLHFFAHATTVECPKFPETQLTGDILKIKLQQCMSARASGQTATIEDFLCPPGDFTYEDNQPLTQERLAYHIAVNLLMNEADKNIKEYMKTLQDLREKDIVAWTQNYGQCLHGKGGSPSANDVYKKICSFSYINNILNTNSQSPIVLSADAYPQEQCSILAKKKIIAWENLAKNLMLTSVHKSFENDRSYFIDAVQGQYRSIIEKFHTYQKIIFRASAKIKVYINEAVK